MRFILLTTLAVCCRETFFVSCTADSHSQHVRQVTDDVIQTIEDFIMTSHPAVDHGAPHITVQTTTTDDTNTTSHPAVNYGRVIINHGASQTAEDHFNTTSSFVIEYGTINTTTGLSQATKDYMSMSLGAVHYATFSDTTDATHRLSPVADYGTVNAANDIIQTSSSEVGNRTINVTTEQLWECITTQGTLNVTGWRGHIYTAPEINKTQQEGFCRLYVVVPVGLLVALDIVSIPSCAYAKVTVTDVGLGPDAPLRLRKLFAECGGIKGTVEVVSFSNKISIILNKLSCSTFCEPFFIDLRFAAVPPSHRPKLETVWLSNTSGWIQSPGYDDGKFYPANMYSCLNVRGPPDHVAMVSFNKSLEVALFEDSLAVFPRANCTGEPIVLISVYLNPLNPLQGFQKPKVLDTEVFSVDVHSDHYPGRVGIRFPFTFHKRSARPEQLSEDSWNCTVPYWPDFKLHFPCDVTADCVRGEDEEDCPYTTQFCGKGKVHIRGKCFALVRTTKAWLEAARYCRELGGWLGSLKTREEWEEIYPLLWETGLLRVSVGMGNAQSGIPDMYRHAFQWQDGTMTLNYYHTEMADKSVVYASNLIMTCGYVITDRMDVPLMGRVFFKYNCLETVTSGHLCEFLPEDSQPTVENSLPHAGVSSLSHVSAPTKPAINISKVSWNWTEKKHFVVCPKNHTAHRALACDGLSDCWGTPKQNPSFIEPDPPGLSTSCPLTLHSPSFACANGLQRVPYTLVCDYVEDCQDGSDEDFCVFPSCGVLNVRLCGNKQCVSEEQLCDGRRDCVNGRDEERCATNEINLMMLERTPVIITLNKAGYLQVKGEFQGPCPETHFECPEVQYCLPVYLRCNGVLDCPGREDEEDCDSYTCPQHYRCRNSRVCLHHQHLCDGLHQCPSRDDEMLCNMTCPDGCVCYGWSFFCPTSFNVSSYPQLRFLHARGSGLSLRDLGSKLMLISVSLARCGLSELHNVSLPNLHILDLSENEISAVGYSQLAGMPALKTLSLAGNPLVDLFPPGTTQAVHPTLQHLDLSHVPMHTVDTAVFAGFTALRFLNLTNTSIQHIVGPGFGSVPTLRELDLRGAYVRTFPTTIYKGLEELQEVHADTFKLCCPVALPEDFALQNCHAPEDEISSCEALLRSDTFRLFLAAFCFLVLFGNAGSFVFRVFIRKTSSKMAFSVFVTHLSLSDLLMGLYLAVIGVADRVYLGNYLWADEEWRTGVVCQMAGFLCLLSCEVSAFVICAITLDRFLVLRFPFGKYHFGRFSANVACALAWFLGLVIASVPLAMTAASSHWQFYSQTGICIPLPVSRRSFHGQQYSFGVFVVLNFVLFVVIALGQVLIFHSVQTNAMNPANKSRVQKDLTIARRLVTVVMSDFLCWFPVGVMGLLTSYGVAIPSVASVSLVIFVMPINSAINPFLYSLQVMLERRRQRQEDRLRRILLAELKQMARSTAMATQASGNPSH